MKKRIYIGLFALVLCFLLVGCGKTKEEKENEKKRTDGTFDIICTKEKEKQETHSVEYVNTYYFNTEQVANKYHGVVTQIYTDKDRYEVIKKTLQETANSSDTDAGAVYKLEADDEKMSLVFTIDIEGYDKFVKTDEEKAKLKASEVLKDNEKDKNTKCVLKGISREDLK